MSKKAHIVVKRDTDSMIATFNLMDTDDETVLDSLSIDWDTVHEDAVPFVQLYGVTKILQDRCSGVELPLKLKAYDELFQATLEQGITSKPKAEQGRRLKAIESEALAKYMSEHYKADVSMTKVSELWSASTEERKLELLEIDRVIELIAELKEDAGAGDFNFDDLG